MLKCVISLAFINSLFYQIKLLLRSWQWRSFLFVTEPTISDDLIKLKLTCVNFKLTSKYGFTFVNENPFYPWKLLKSSNRIWSPTLFILFSGWLEPLLDRIAENKSNVVTPVIDVIDDDTLKYQYSSAQSTSVGGFDWNLQVGESKWKYYRCEPSLFH